MTDYSRIVKECFWDLSISEDDVTSILNSQDLPSMKLLFEKILLNSTKLLYDLEFFDRGDLQILLDNYKIPHFNSEYIFRRKNIAEVYFFNKSLQVEELQWPA